MDVTIYHNPACGTSRTTLQLIRDAGIEPRVVEYLKEPLSRAELREILRVMGMPARDLLREKEPLVSELGLDDPDAGEDRLLDAMTAHPVLMNRPVVVTDKGARLCRPADRVHDLL